MGGGGRMLHVLVAFLPATARTWSLTKSQVRFCVCSSFPVRWRRMLQVLVVFLPARTFKPYQDSGEILCVQLFSCEVAEDVANSCCFPSC